MLAALAGKRLNSEVLVREVLFTGTAYRSFTVLRRFPLAVARRPDGDPVRGAGRRR